MEKEAAAADDCPEFSYRGQDVRYAHVLSPVRRRVHRRRRRVTPTVNMVFACVQIGAQTICRHTHTHKRRRPNINIRLLWEVINTRGGHDTSSRTQPGGPSVHSTRDTGDETKTANIQVQFIGDGTDRRGERPKKKKQNRRVRTTTDVTAHW